MGDGMAAAFASARDAVTAGVVASKVGLRSLERPPGTSSSPRRLHTGEGEARQRPVPQTSPSIGAPGSWQFAHGGQVVISATTEPLVHGGLPSGVTLSDLGEHQLRDLAEANSCVPGLSSRSGQRFPPLRSLDSLPGNLSPQLTSFVGRDEELLSLVATLHSSRLVTLTGPGGVGKTRLAWQVAAETLPSFPGGAWSCELATVEDADGMLQVVRGGLGRRPANGRDAGGEYRRVSPQAITTAGSRQLRTPPRR